METLKALLLQVFLFILGLVLSQVGVFIWATFFKSQFSLEGLVLFVLVFMVIWYKVIIPLFSRSKSAARAAQRRRAGTTTASDKPANSGKSGKSGS